MRRSLRLDGLSNFPTAAYEISLFLCAFIEALDTSEKFAVPLLNFSLLAMLFFLTMLFLGQDEAYSSFHTCRILSKPVMPPA